MWRKRKNQWEGGPEKIYEGRGEVDLLIKEGTQKKRAR